MKAVGFGYKTAWIAIRCDSMNDVADALALRNGSPASWQEGVEFSYVAAHDDKTPDCFITPPIDGWVLVTSSELLSLCGEQPPEFLEFITELSKKLNGTEVQFFATHRVVETHAWARARNGQLLRAYFYSGNLGETLLDIGTLTPEEMNLDFTFFNEKSPDANLDGYWEREDLTFPSEKNVRDIAAKWSLAPMDLEGRYDEVELGIAGQIFLPASEADFTDDDVNSMEGETPEQTDTEEKPRPWWKLW